MNVHVSIMSQIISYLYISLLCSQQYPQSLICDTDSILASVLTLGFVKEFLGFSIKKACNC